MRLRILLLLFAVTVAGAGNLIGQVAPADQIPNWSVPPTWSPSSAGGIQTMTDVSEPRLYVAISPCRIADTRAGQGFSGQAGPPGLTSFMNRTFQISGSPATLPAPPNGCPANAIPTGADAVSIQFTVVFPTSSGNLVAWQAGAAQPQISVLNWDAGVVALGSGTIIPLSAIGQITVRLNTAAAGQGAQLVIDVNGYFSEELGSPGNVFRLNNNSTNYTAFFTNSSTLCDSDCGIVQQVEGGNAISGYANETNGSVNTGVTGVASSTGNGSAGVRGVAGGTTGYVFGVKGTTSSQGRGAAGVKGVNGSGDPLGDTQFCTECYQAGVRGVGFLGYGVLGMTEDLSSAAGVGGVFLSSAEAQQTIGYLGFSAVVAVYGQGDIAKTGTVSFVEPHPTDADKLIQYASLEGPEAGTYFRGKGRFQNGLATIEVPDDFRIVSAPEGLSIQVTPIGQMATVAVLEINLDRIVVRGSRNVEFFYTVNGIRLANRNYSPIVENRKEFIPGNRGEKMPASYSDEFKRRLIANGTYRPDGTVNLETAERLGWDRVWAKREETEPRPEKTSNQHE